MPLILGTNSIKDTGYNVDNSLRFNSGSSDYLTRTFGTPTSSQKWTLSFWVKRCKLGSTEFVFNTDGGNEEDRLQFNSGNTLTWYEQNSSAGTDAELTTSQVFRDISAWYHIVVARDSTQGTASNRIKLYVNGSQVTALGTATYPSQNDSSRFNTAVAHEIGARNGGTFVNLYMAEVCFIDGQQLDPTSFGEFDEDSGIWKPIDVSGLTFGNNGFYLDFEDSSALGNDAAGSNNFTVNNLTAIDQSTDTCTNNFATLNPLGTVQLGTLSEGNLKLVSSSAYKIATSTIAVSSGKWYVENKITGSSPDAMLGVIDVQDYQTNSSINYAGDKTNSVGYYKDGRKFIANSASSYGASYTTNDIIGIALDLDSGTKTITFYKNGASQGAINLPTAGSEEWYFLPSPYNATIEVNFGSPPYSESGGNSDGNGYGNFAASVPANHYSLNTKNLAEYG